MSNLRTSMTWLLETGEPEAGLRLASALWEFCHSRGHYEEGRAWLRGAISRDGGPPALRARAFTGAGVLALLQCEYAEASEHLEESLALHRELDDQSGSAEVTEILGGLAREQGDYERAVALHEESLALSRELEDERGIASSLDYLGFVAWLGGEYDRAAELCEEALSMHRAEGDTSRILSSLINLGSAALYSEDYGRAEAMLEESLALSERDGYREGTGWSLNQLGVAAYLRGEHERAEQLLRESLAVHKDLGDKWRMASVFEAMAETAGARKRFGRSARLFGTADAIRETIGAPVPPCERAAYDSAIDFVRARMGAEAFARTRAEGRTMTLEEAFSQAIEPEVEAPGTPAGATNLLSVREVEVLGLVAEGLTDQEVAQRLYLSPRTVGQHLRSVYRKLGVKSRTAATHAAVERGLI
ncbi:MAG: tetratricopeptide repeat protein [Rubrobacter sp.]